MKADLQISIDEIPDGVIMCDRNGVIQATNQSIRTLLGYRSEELSGKPIEVLVPARYDHHHHQHLRESYMDAPVSRPMGDIQRIYGLAKDGTEVPLDISLQKHDKDDLFICFLRDVSEHVRLTKEIERTAYFDPVTGALNRRAFNEDLANTIAEQIGADNRICVSLFDLDHFKDVNDTLGHSVGDKLLVAFCDRLREVMTEDMRLYRIGGDEFALIIPGCTTKQHEQAFVETALWHVRKPLMIDKHELSVRCSAGIVHAPDDGTDPDELMSNADLALYEAKRVRGKVSAYTPQLRHVMENRFALLSELQTAYETGAFELYFQPKIDIGSGQIAGAEALLRWNHPMRGLLSPGQFIDVLDDSEISIAIGRWVLFESCKKAREWRDASGRAIGIAVNLFPRQTYSRTFINDVVRALSDAGLDPACLELELTENTILDSAADFIETLKFLRGMGISVALDDFGTGYASLNSLIKYPVDTIKVDKSFVSDVCRTPDNQAVLRAIIGLTSELSLHTVAEGVETVEDAKALQQLGFEMAQGYFWSQPIPHAKFITLLTQPAGRKGINDGIAAPEKRLTA